MKEKQLRKIIREELLKEGKYNVNGSESNMASIIADTLFENKQFPQLKTSNVSDISIESDNGLIEFKYKLDEIYTGNGTERIEPVMLDVVLNINVRQR